MVHACEVTNEAEKAIAIRRASGFNELFEEVLKKECQHEAESGSVVQHDSGELGSGLIAKGKEKDTQQFGPEVEALKLLAKKLIQEGVGAASKWTWGVDLVEADLGRLIRGADRHNNVSHSGYDSELPSASLPSHSSEVLDHVKLEDPNNQDLCFDELSKSITIIPELVPHQFPTYSTILVQPDDVLADSEPDPIIIAFTQRARKEAKKLMQDEVDEPVSYFDYGSEFVARTPLILCRPWLFPRLPIIVPPNNSRAPPTQTISSESDTDDHLILPESDTGSAQDILILPDSDEISEDLILPDSNSSRSSHIALPESDDNDSDAMDVVSSDRQTTAHPGAHTETPMIVGQSDSGSESSGDVIVPSHPSNISLTSQPSIVGGFERDQSTGRFTAASFSRFHDDLLS